jgi:protein involved in polysaccharide export with SLBB domain
MKPVHRRLLVLYSAALLAGACASVPGRRVVAVPPTVQPPVPPPLAAASADDRFLLAVGDELDVKFPYRPDFNEHAVVRPDGKISLPLLGEVTVEGKAPDELQKELAELYRGLEPKGEVAQRRYLIHVNDELSIRFTHQKDFDDTVRVRPDGRISLPLVKSVIAAGKTPEALERELIDSYRGHLKAPDLVVIVRSVARQEYQLGDATRPVSIAGLETVAVLVRLTQPRKVFVGGEVMRPGFLPYTGPTTALRAVVEAGGPRPSGRITQVVVLRRVDANNSAAFFLNLKQDMKGKATNDVALRANDVVVVPRTAVASLGLFLDQYLYSLLPIARNSTFNFIHNLNPTSSVIPVVP